MEALLDRIADNLESQQSTPAFAHSAEPLVSQIFEAVGPSEKRDDLHRWLTLHGWSHERRVLPNLMDPKVFYESLRRWNAGEPLPAKLEEILVSPTQHRHEEAGSRVTYQRFERFLEELAPVLDRTCTVLRDTRGAEQLEATRQTIRCKKVKIVVTALMKAGKSTLLNALLGQDLLPHQTLAATATITKIKHHSLKYPDEEFPAGSQTYLSVNGENFTGQAIYDKLKQVNDQTRARLEGPDGANASLPVMTLHTHVPFLDGAKFEDVGSVTCKLYDTPGVDEAAADVLVYVMDCQRIGNDRDAEYIPAWFKKNPEFKNISTRSACCLFVGNKFDSTELEADAMLREMKNFVEKCVSAGEGGREIFQPSQFVLCSAQRAFLLRTRSNQCMGKAAAELWTSQMKRYGKKEGKDDKLAKLFEDHRLEEVEAALGRQIWQQRLSVLLETHSQQTSNILMHAWNQLTTIRRSVEYRQEAVKRYQEAQVIMESVQSRLTTQLGGLLDHYIEEVSGYIRSETTQWGNDMRAFLDFHIKTDIAADTDDPLREFFSQQHKKVLRKVNQSKIVMQSSLRSHVTQLQMMIADKIRSELATIYQYLHTSIDNLLETHLTPLLGYLDLELPEADELNIQPDMFVEPKRRVNIQIQPKTVYKTRIVPGCITNTTEEYEDVQLVHTESHEEYFQLRLSRYKEAWLDNIDHAVREMSEPTIRIMTEKRMRVEQQARNSIGSYIENYREAMNPESRTEADLQEVCETMELLAPFCSRISSIIDAVNDDIQCTNMTAPTPVETTQVSMETPVPAQSGVIPPPPVDVQPVESNQKGTDLRTSLLSQIQAGPRLKPSQVLPRHVSFRNTPSNLENLIHNQILSRRIFIRGDEADQEADASQWLS
ncbi:hypothetical protein PROFUN_02883 [Planoprotostelium fungivorum]|uniref:WH2 domain-containing protein n=1 Tax=Planoprotostelium fungivorum TaxID=1890364 RepID=A0A2P6NRZ3_9EUKA|nr:hypothetical protein PROFUN_02883 [Planoprotostelium fungivorum]